MTARGQRGRATWTTASAVARWAVLAVMAIALTGGGAGCDDDDRESNRVDLVLKPGQSAAFTFEITVDESEEADFLESCDFVDIVEIDPQNLAAEIDNFGKSGSFECAANMIVAAWPEVEPGEYQIRVRFYYTYFSDCCADEDDTDGYIRVTVVE